MTKCCFPVQFTGNLEGQDVELRRQFEPAHEIMVLINMRPAKAQASLRLARTFAVRTHEVRKYM